MAIYLHDGTILTEGNAIATHEDCCCGDTNEQWKRCDTHADIAVLSAGHTDVDYAWLCSASVWRASYNDSISAGTPTDPAVLKQCGLVGAPTECPDLLGWPLDDGFSTGEDCDSHDLDGLNALMRWDSGFNATYWAWANGSVELEMDDPRPSDLYQSSVSCSFTSNLPDDFEIGMSFFDFVHRNTEVTTNRFHFRLWGGVNHVSIFFGWSTSQSKVFVWKRTGGVGGAFDYLPTSDTDAKIRIRRVGTTIYWDYDHGTGWTNIDSEVLGWSFDKLEIGLLLQSRDTPSRMLGCKFTDVYGLDDDSNTIIIDPEGTARGLGCP